MIKVSKKTRNDIILFSLLLFISILLLLLFASSGRQGKYVRVEVNGELYGRYLLDTDASIDIGDSNRLIISSGSVYMESARCPDKTCVKQGKISRVGQSIICLPNRVIVVIEDDSSDFADDIVIG